MFNSVIPAAMTVSSFVICLLSALVLGVLTALVFSFRSRHSGNLPFALVLVPPIVTLVIMMVNGNIGAGLGVAGAFSLIRFRSAPGTARELSGLFTGTAIGLACGMGYVVASCASRSPRIWITTACLTTFSKNTPPRTSSPRSRPPTWAPSTS